MSGHDHRRAGTGLPRPRRDGHDRHRRRPTARARL